MVVTQRTATGRSVVALRSRRKRDPLVRHARSRLMTEKGKFVEECRVEPVQADLTLEKPHTAGSEELYTGRSVAQI